MRLLLSIFLLISALSSSERPNILLISIDDLNNWIGCLEGHPQSLTPNVDRLAKESILFRDAHCVAPSCNPSRTATLTGLTPWRSGVYSNSVKWREALPKVITLPHAFKNAGYLCVGGGKIFHHFQNDERGWHEYYPKMKFEFPKFSFTRNQGEPPLEIKYQSWKNHYREFSWGPYPEGVSELENGDHATVNFLEKKLKEIKPGQPFFMNCGIYRPHVPWYIPQKYLDKFPIDNVELPKTIKGDLNDLPEKIRKRTNNDPFYKALEKAKLHREAVQGYLASVHYMDTVVGRMLDCLNKSQHAHNTIVVFWSDHGYHMGEKQRYRKFSLWDESTHVPLMIRLPNKKTGICETPVSLQDIYPTLMELAQISPPHQLSGHSLVPILNDTTQERPSPVITVNSRNTAYSVRTKEWTYIYRNDGEELYDRSNDPQQWHNLAQEKNREIMDSLKKFIPANQAPVFSQK